MSAIILAASLAAAQPVALPEQAALAQCLDQFVATQAQAAVADFTNALATACAVEEQAFRAAYIARAAERGTSYVPADTEAFDAVLALRNSRRDAFLAAQTTCVRGNRT